MQYRPRVTAFLERSENVQLQYRPLRAVSSGFRKEQDMWEGHHHLNAIKYSILVQIIFWPDHHKIRKPSYLRVRKINSIGELCWNFLRFFSRSPANWGTRNFWNLKDSPGSPKVLWLHSSDTHPRSLYGHNFEISVQFATGYVSSTPNQKYCPSWWIQVYLSYSSVSFGLPEKNENGYLLIISMHHQNSHEVFVLLNRLLYWISQLSKPHWFPIWITSMAANLSCR